LSPNYQLELLPINVDYALVEGIEKVRELPHTIIFEVIQNGTLFEVDKNCVYNPEAENNKFLIEQDHLGSVINKLSKNPDTGLWRKK